MTRVCRGGAVVSGCVLPQFELPVFPASRCASTTELAIEPRESVVVYCNCPWPVGSHPTPDRAVSRRFVSQFIANGAASPAQLARAFSVPLVTVKRAGMKLRQEGAAGCFRPSVPRPGHRLIAVVLAAAQALPEAGYAPAAAAGAGVQLAGRREVIPPRKNRTS